jgi:hypothetical protein
VNADDIISYHELVTEEGANLQKGMNFGVGGEYSVLLMSVRKGAPYADQINEKTGTLIYEGHDEPDRKQGPRPKDVDQPMLTPNGKWTENGKFFRAAKDFKSGLRKHPELVKVYEKIDKGIWSYKGYFALQDAKIQSDGARNVFKFLLHPVDAKQAARRKPKIVELPHTRMIPTHVKLEVYRRDKGRCVICGSTTNLHYDHDFPYSKGGTSLKAENIRLLCAKHNLQKGAKIVSIAPWLIATGTSIDLVSRS